MNVPKLRFKEFTDEWQKKTLKSVSSYFKSGKSIKSSDILEKGLYPVYGGNGLRGYTNTFNFDGNASLIGRQGALCGNVTYVKGKNYMTEHAVIVQSNHDNYNKFLFYILFSMNLNQYSTQSAQPGLSVSNLLALFNYFPNIKEQTKIANFLSTVDKKISNLEDIITNLEKQKKGLLQQIFNQELRFKDENDNNYPDWEKKKLGDNTTSFSGGTPSVNVRDYYYGSIPFIKSGEIHNDFTETFITEAGLISSSAKLVNKGDLLFALYGATSGDTSISKINGAINQAVLCVRSKTLNLHYLYQLLNFYRKKLLSIYLQGGQGNFSASIFKNLTFKFPCLEEQTKIADFLSAFDRKIDNQKAQLEHWKQIKKGLLQQMFV